MGIVKLNVTQLAALVLVAMPAMTLGASDASEGGVVVFNPDLATGIVE